MTETKNTFRILFYIKRNALLRNGSAPIMGRITINGERAQFSTRLSVDPQVWDPHSGRVLGRRAPAERINERLDRIRMRLEQCYESLLDHAQRLTPNAVKNLFFGREQHREQLLGFFRRHNEEFGRMVGINRSKATFYKYRCVCNHLESYIRTRYGRDDLESGELDREFLYGFHRHISGACGCSKNTIWIYMIALKHILAQARSRGYLKADLFAGYKIRSERVLRGYLSVEEIRRLIRLDLPDRTQRLIRDAFLFGCFTGLSYVDIRQLTPQNIQYQDRQIWICTSRCKTASEVSVRLFPVAEAILSRHLPVPGRRPDFRPAHKRMVQCLPAGRSAAGGHLAPHHVPLRPAHLRHHHHTVAGSGNRDDLQAARAQKHTHHTDLCDTHPCKAGKRYGVIVRTARKAICAMNRHPCISDCTKSKKILKQGFYRENTRYKS